MKCLSLKLLVVSCLFLFPHSGFAKQLIPMGQAISIELNLQQVVVTHDVLLVNGEWLKKGDIITDFNGKSLHQLAPLDHSSSEEINLTVQRQKRQSSLILTRAELQSVLPFLKDTTEGNGTLTFIDPVTNQYGAIGHQIVDADLNAAPNFNEGHIYLASIEQFKKSKPGNPGYKISKFERSLPVGSVTANQFYGIFGQYDEPLQQSVLQPLNIIPASEIVLGEATMLTAIKGKKVEAFSIKIDEVKGDHIQFTITDDTLIKETGGILQGMSGSPIIQNNSFVGAVTHMYVEKPTLGAGISILEMFKKSHK